ncbi:hypothetical protein ACFV1W_36565 [Kitasatospora sp. NPDC059648]
MNETASAATTSAATTSAVTGVRASTYAVDVDERHPDAPSPVG